THHASLKSFEVLFNTVNQLILFINKSFTPVCALFYISICPVISVHDNGSLSYRSRQRNIWVDLSEENLPGIHISNQFSQTGDRDLT
ncbi:hypothetical protein L9F63_023197, partial [Diploptera punctata]